MTQEPRTATGTPGLPGRDRDLAGRPRSARPRDGLGRPLARSEAGQDRMPDDLTLAGPAAARLADRLLREGRPFHAHEVLEASWKTGPAAERDLWQGLAQIAVGLTHARRGNARGATALLRRGSQRVRAYLAAGGRAGPHGMDLTAFLTTTERLADRIEHQGLTGLGPSDLAPGLLAAP